MKLPGIAGVLGASLLVTAAALLSQTSREATGSIEQRVNDLVGKMTLEEKISQMQNHSAAIPRLGVPEYDWWNEGLHGIARSGYATVFPQAIGLAATWDTKLLHTVAETISTEARAKYNEAMRQGIHSIYYGLTIWSPNINIFRDPRWGRGQETYGEDPYLTARLGVAFVTGLQGDNPDYLKTVATPKHFAVHSGPESERHRFDVKPTAFDLESTYLPAFRATITEARADSLMCAYNALNGVPACASRELLESTLREAWHFDGYVTSDCGAVSDFYEPGAHGYSPDREHGAAAALLTGTDTSCGTEFAGLLGAVKQGLVSADAIDRAVKRLFTARFRLGLFDDSRQTSYAQIPFRQNDSDQHRALALEVARKSMVLLKNDKDVLPIGPNIKTIAVIGPNAASLASLEGNYNAVPSHPVLPLDGMEKEFAGRARILYAQGSPYVNGAPVPVPRTALRPADKNAETGLHAEYFDNDEFRGKPILARTDQQVDFDWNSASPVAGLDAKQFSVRWSGTVSVPEPGDYQFSVQFAHCYPCFSRESYAVYLDGKRLDSAATDETKSSHASGNKPFSVHFADTQPHALRAEYAHRSKLFGAGVTLSWIVPPRSLLREAVEKCRQADAVAAFVGLSPELEGEEMPVHVAGFAGGDRTKIELPDAQDEMLQAVSATGKPLIVVLLNGSALAVPSAKQLAAGILEAWYPGEAGGEAIAESLIGKNNPGGRLPVTFYASTDQLPPFDDYSMKGRTYRYFHGEPLFRFGDGMSYTQFAYSGLRLSSERLSAGETLTVEADVRNSGRAEGDEVVQLYLTTPNELEGEIHALRAFKRTKLAAGASQRVELKLDARALSSVSEKGERRVTPGTYKLTVGGEQPGAKVGGLSASFTITGSFPLPR